MIGSFFEIDGPIYEFFYEVCDPIKELFNPASIYGKKVKRLKSRTIFVRLGINEKMSFGKLLSLLWLKSKTCKLDLL